MIFSREHNYLFLEVANTASTATRFELMEFYNGQDIPKKRHAFIGEARRQLGDDFVDGAFRFCCVRNPLDIVVTRYEKIRTNHKDIFGRKVGGVAPWRQEAYAFTQSGGSFVETLQRFPDLLNFQSFMLARRCNAVMRFENLHEDFPAVLRQIGIEPVRPLPRVNRTSEKAPFQTYFDERALEIAKPKLTALMDEFGYDWPQPVA